MTMIPFAALIVVTDLAYSLPAEKQSIFVAVIAAGDGMGHSSDNHFHD
ncbi:hypothetical protein [Methylocapsa sp. S129]